LFSIKFRIFHLSITYLKTHILQYVVYGDAVDLLPRENNVLDGGYLSINKELSLIERGKEQAVANCK
jgi:hypothetical protein